MRWQILLLAGVFGPAALGAGVPSASRDENCFTFQVQDGRALLEWVSASTFRFCRGWGPDTCTNRVFTGVEVEISEQNTANALILQTEHLKVEIEKSSLRIRVWNRREGRQLMADAAPPARTADGVVVERLSPPEERFFGLGVRADKRIESRGEVIVASRPFLLSTMGYGVYYPASGRYEFDLARSRPDRCRIQGQGAGWLEYYFHYGPTPKEVMEEHKEVVESGVYLQPLHFALLTQRQLPKRATLLPSPEEGTWDSLRGTLRALIHGSMSAVALPAMDLSPYQSANEPLLRRAAQLARVVPLVYGANLARPDPEAMSVQQSLARFRRDYAAFFLAYAQDIRERGHPIIHPLPLQFPKDAFGYGIDDEFLLGDEILVAPLLHEGTRRSVYLPMGSWTDLRTNVRYPGRRVVKMEAGEEGPILLAKNGSIVPVGVQEGGAVMTLHYFPRLAAEFFLFEPDSGEYTQIHASPAGDQIRLEVEAKRERTYEWVVHHLSNVSKVVGNGVEYARVSDAKSLKRGAWHYDRARENLHVRLEARSEGHDVIYVHFENDGAER